MTELTSPKGISNIIIGVVFFTLFLSVFFFTYAAKVENKIVKDQITFLVDDFTSGVSNFGYDKEKANILLESLEAPNLEEEDKMVEESNKKLLEMAKKVLIIFTIGAAIVVYYLSNKYKFDLKELIKENAILLLAVAVVEYIFITHIGGSFRSLDPNSVKLNIIKNIRNISK